MRIAFKYIFTLLILSFVSSCSIYGPVNGHRASTNIELNNLVTLEQVFKCVESSVIAFHEKDSWWAVDFTHIDFKMGVLETGNFSDSNIAGIRFKLTFNKNDNTYLLDLKANGPYYIDLGAHKAIDKLKSDLFRCTST